MRRSRILGIVGIALGLSGCAGTNQCVLSNPANRPGMPPGASPVACARHGVVTPTPPVVAAPPTVVMRSPSGPVTTAAAPNPSPMPQSSRDFIPTSSQPIAVPAPVAMGVVHYFPLPGDLTVPRNMWDSAPPDPLGVRTSLETEIPAQNAPGQNAPAQNAPAPAPTAQPAAPAAATGPATLPVSLSVPKNPVPRRSLASRIGDLHWPFGAKPRQGSDVIPASVDLTSPPEPVLFPPSYAAAMRTNPNFTRQGDSATNSDERPKLASATDTDLAGRPRLESLTPTSATATTGDDAVPPPTPRKPLFNFHLPKFNAFSSDTPVLPRPSAVVTKFARRIRGAAHGFLDPDSIRREPRDVAERGDVAERVASHSLDESAER